jgi:FkbM family methyltransferase
MPIQKEEILFYETIKDNCSIIFDIGCREDTDYISLSENKIFHYFEPNPNSYLVCSENLKSNKNNIVYLNNFGIGKQTKKMDYYPDGQSFFRRTYIYVSTSDPIILSMERFSDYIKRNGIDNIDFLKMDVEGGEPDILLDNPCFIKSSVKYIQFEWGSTWVDRGDGASLDDIIKEFNEYFNFYFLHDENHPSSKIYTKLLTKIDDEKMIKEMTDYMMQGHTFNIVMIGKSK